MPVLRPVSGGRMTPHAKPPPQPSRPPPEVPPETWQGCLRGHCSVCSGERGLGLLQDCRRAFEAAYDDQLEHGEEDPQTGGDPSRAHQAGHKARRWRRFVLEHLHQAAPEHVGCLRLLRDIDVTMFQPHDTIGRNCRDPRGGMEPCPSCWRHIGLEPPGARTQVDSNRAVSSTLV